MSNSFKVILLGLLAVICQFSLLGVFLAPKVQAAGANVQLSVSVLPRPATDTINDFDFSQLNPSGQGKVYL